jgi:hypothetical protein
MLNTTTTLSIQGSSKDPATQQELMGMEARLEYDGRINMYKSYPDRKIYNDNKAVADADYDKFEAYANAIFDKVLAGESATEEV